MAEQVLSINQQGSRSIDQYLEYTRIVRDDDNGKMFSDAEYENYKKTVVAKRMKNRLYVAWVNNDTNMQCKQIGPESKCFCRHRYHQHRTDFAPTSDPGHRDTTTATSATTPHNLNAGDTPSSACQLSVIENAESPPTSNIRLECQQPGCQCSHYYFVNSFQERCRCKHLMDNHHQKGAHTCSYPKCSCQGYRTSSTCTCGTPAHKHSTIVQTRQQRLDSGLPVGRDTPYKAMGGLTGFSSLADGVQRLDPSGAGAPASEFLSQPITASDHPVLKAYKQKEATYQRPGEDDMDYYERRYKERQKEEKMKARSIKR